MMVKKCEHSKIYDKFTNRSRMPRFLFYNCNKYLPYSDFNTKFEFINENILDILKNLNNLNALNILIDLIILVLITMNSNMDSKGIVAIKSNINQDYN